MIIKTYGQVSYRFCILMPFNDPYMLSMDFTVEAVNNNMTAMCKEGNADHKLYYFADIDLRNEMDKTFMS